MYAILEGTLLYFHQSLGRSNVFNCILLKDASTDTLIMEAIVSSQNLHFFAEPDCLKVLTKAERSFANRSERRRKSYTFDGRAAERVNAYFFDTFKKAYIFKIFTLIKSFCRDLLQRSWNAYTLHTTLSKHFSFDFMPALCLLFSKFFKSFVQPNIAQLLTF